jgi:ribose transport system permease protein
MAAKILRPDDIRKWLPLATLAALILLVGIAQPSFLELGTLIGLASDTAVLFILATGATFVIMLGGIDLSIQSMASLASVIVALTVTPLGYGSFLVAIAIGAVAGLISGIMHVRLKIPSFIATLAMGGVLFSAALVISKERSITLNEAGRAYQAWMTGQAFGLPNVISIGLLVLAAAHILQAHTRFGRYSAAIGAGEPAAYASGVKVARQKIFAFVLSAAALRAARPLWLQSSCCLR